MRRIRSVLCVVAAAGALSGGFSPLALAGWNDCRTPPPAWYTAPRLTHTYSYTYGTGYSRAASHEYSAQRRYTSPPRYQTTQSRRYHDPFGRW